MADFPSKFHWADYLLFALSFAVSVLVGVGLAIKQNFLKQSSEDYLMANRQMNWFLVAMSILATAMNALIFVGFTAEYYYYGFTAVWLVLSYYVGCIPVIIFVIPKFYRLGFKLTSAYSYFQFRFNLAVRMVVAFMYFILTLLFLSVVLYIPSLVMAQVSVINIYWSVFLGAGVCLLYTAFGGMKAVIWVDNIQVLIIAVGTLTLAIKGSIDAGGISKVWEIYSGIGERNNWDDINAEPWDRHNVWNISLLLGLVLISRFACDQSLLQRYMTVPDMRRSQVSLLVGVTVALMFLAVVMVMGMVAFAALGGNEPLLKVHGDPTDPHKLIDKGDQIMPYFMMAILGRYHGIPGLFVAAIFAAALSTISSGQTGLAAVLLEDFIKPLYFKRKGKHLSETAAGRISKLVGMAVGLVILALAMAAPNMGSNVIEMSLSFQGFILGPLLGLLVAGFWCFWVESWGALGGLLVSVAWSMMMYFGTLKNTNKIGQDQPPLFTRNFSVPNRIPEPTAEPTIWDTSYTWYTLMALIIVLVVSTIISLIVHCIKRSYDKNYGLKEMMPSDDVRFTMEDFYVAMGCRKNRKEMIDEQEYEMNLHRSADVADVDKGQDNIAFKSESVRL